MLLGDPDRLLEHLRRGRGDDPLDEETCPLVERAARRAVRVALDPAPGRVGGPGGDPGQLERARVHPGAMDVAVDDVDRAIRHDHVEVFAAGRAAGELVHVPAGAEDPARLGVCSRVVGDRLEISGPAAPVVQVDLLAVRAVVGRVEVAVLKAGQHRPPAQLNDAGARSDETPDVAVRPDRHDPPAPDRHRLGARPIHIDGVNDSSDERDVSLRFRCHDLGAPAAISQRLVLVSRVGIEPTTGGLKVPCSTTELTARRDSAIPWPSRCWRTRSPRRRRPAGPPRPGRSGSRDPDPGGPRQAVRRPLDGQPSAIAASSANDGASAG